MSDAPDAADAPAARLPARPPIDSLLLAATRIATFEHQRGLTNASGFFFERDERLVLDWYPGTGPAAPTQVEVRFESVREGTRVIVLHTEGPAGEELYRRRVEAYDRSWDLVLAALGRAAGEGGALDSR